MDDSILGIGTDIIEIERIKKALDRHGKHFMDRIYTQSEQQYCLSVQWPYPRFATRFAAKEAVVKALGCGFTNGISWHDIEITHNPQGQPQVLLSDLLHTRFNRPRMLISLSHSRDYATATSLWLRRSQESSCSVTIQEGS